MPVQRLHRLTQGRGALTLVFTGIVGRTRLWSEHSDDMGTALSTHDEITSRAVAEHGGLVFKHTGDGEYGPPTSRKSWPRSVPHSSTLAFWDNDTTTIDLAEDAVLAPGTRAAPSS